VTIASSRCPIRILLDFATRNVDALRTAKTVCSNSLRSSCAITITHYNPVIMIVAVRFRTPLSEAIVITNPTNTKPKWAN
jgi:hypothetical protein